MKNKPVSLERIRYAEKMELKGDTYDMTAITIDIESSTEMKTLYGEYLKELALSQSGDQKAIDALPELRKQMQVLAVRDAKAKESGIMPLITAAEEVEEIDWSAGDAEFFNE